MEKINMTVKSINNDGTITAYVSPAVIDRMADFIPPSEWMLEDFRKHPVLLSQHSYYGSLQNQIGKAIDFGTDENGLWMKFEYYFGAGNDEADWAYYLAQKSQAAYSVGFISGEQEMKEMNGKTVRILKKNQLLEVSQVLIPANQDAVQHTLIKTMKDFIDSREIPKPEVTPETPAKAEEKSAEEIEIELLKEIINKGENK